MSSRLIAGLAMALVLVSAVGAAAKAGDPRVVQGVVAWAPAGDGPAFVVVRGDDGRHYVADLSVAQRRGEPVGIGDRVSVAGIEGAQPWQVAALVVGSGDSALTALPTSPDSPSASPAMTPAAPDRPAPPSRPWRRIHGTVDAVTNTTLRLRDIDGRKVNVDVSQLGGSVGTTLRPGDRTTVFVVAQGGERLVAVGLVQTDAAAASALPRQPR